MKLIDSDGYGVELTIAGYQFPDHTDPRIRYSWLMIAGSAHCPEGSWSFRWQALGIDDTVELAAWLARLASVPELPEAVRLSFVEPNLSFAAAPADGDRLELRIGLDLEFSPPWRRRTEAGDPYHVTARLTRGEVAAAAADLRSEVEAYLPPGGRLPGHPR